MVESCISLGWKLVCGRYSGLLPVFLSIRTAPEPITSDSTPPVEMRYLRMVFSAPMEISSERLLWAMDSNLQPW